MTQISHNNPPNKKRRPAAFRMLRTITIALVLLVVIVVGGLSYLVLNTNQLRSTLEYLLSSVTERKFQISGDFDFQLGEELLIHAESVSWENASWTSTEHMLKIDSIDLQINVKSLFVPPLVISSANAVNAQLEFEWADDGRMNWVFFESESESEDDAPTHPLPVLLDTAYLENVELVFKNPALTSPLEITVYNITQEQDENNNLVIQSQGVIKNRPFTINGVVGPFPQLVVAGAISMEARIEGKLQLLKVKADVDNLKTFSGADFDVDWQASEFANTLEALSLPIVTSGPVNLKAKLTNKNDQLNGHIDGDLGEFSVAGKLTAPDLSLLTNLHATFHSKGPSAYAAGKVAGIAGLPKAPYQLDVQADSKDNVLHISHFFLKTADAEIRGGARLPRPPSFIDADANLQLYGTDIGRFQGLTDTLNFPKAAFSATVAMQGNGEGITDVLQGKFTIGRMSGDISAQLTEAPEYLGSSIDYSLIFPEAQGFAEVFGITLIKNDVLTADGSMEIRKAGAQLKDLTINIGDNQLRASGLIPWANMDKPIKISTKTSGPNFRALIGYYLPVPFGPPEKFDLQGSIDLRPGETLFASNMGTVGSAKITTTMTAVIDSNETNMRTEIDVSGSNLDEWLQNFVTEHRIKESFDFKSTFQLKGNTFSSKDFHLGIRTAILSGDIEIILADKPNTFSDIRFDISALGENLALELPKFSSYEPAPVAYQIEAKGKISEREISFEKITGNLGDATLNIQGAISLPPAKKSQQLIFDIKGNHLNSLGSMEDWSVADVPFNIKGAVESSDNSIQLNNLDLIVGPNDIRGKLSITSDDTPHITADIASKNFEIAAILTKDQSERLNSVLDDKTKGDGKIIPDVDIPIDLLKGYNADLEITIDRIFYKEDELNALYLQTSLNNGALNVSSFKATTTFGNIDSSISYKPAGDSYALKSTLQANKVRLPGTTKQVVDRDNYKGYDLDIDVEGTGTNIREIAGTLNGFVWMQGSERKYDNVKYSSLFGDTFTEIGIMINPFHKKDPYTNVVCEVYLFEANDGILETAPVAFIKTDKLNVSSVGTVNLKTEELKLGIETVPRKGIGISASSLFTPFIRVGGTLETPKPEVDPSGSLIEGGAALYTGGLTIVAKGLYQRWIKADKSCQQYVNIGRDIRRQRNPELTPPDQY
ncbi:MAG: AsmA family protein [Oceanicoccus sp.]